MVERNLGGEVIPQRAEELTGLHAALSERDLKKLMLMTELRFKEHKVRDNGLVVLVDWMGDDQSIVEAARTSYGEGTKALSDDRTLIRYLMRRWHSTPFEMCELKFLVQVPMDTWRQWIRHRTANVNEYSTRYSIALDFMEEVKPEEWRLQATSNRQGSGDMLTAKIKDLVKWSSESVNGYLYLNMEPRYEGDFAALSWRTDTETNHVGISEEEYENGTVGEVLTKLQERMQTRVRRDYEMRIAAGVAREQARMDLPLSTFTRAYWKIDLHNLFHFLRLRFDNHAQQEIREYAEVIADVVRQLYPVAYEAFVDYRVEAVTWSRLEQTAFSTFIQVKTDAYRCGDDVGFDEAFGIACKSAGFPLGKREANEFRSKLERVWKKP